MPKATASPRSDSDGRPQRPTHRRGETRGAILAAARRLIARKGDFTTQELIREARVALKTFYRYFPSKDQLLVTLFGDLIEENAALLEAQAAAIADPVSRLEFFVTAPLRMMDDGARPEPALRDLRALAPAPALPPRDRCGDRPFTDLVQKELEAGRDAGVLAPRNPERDAWQIATMVMAVFHHYTFHPDDPARATAADDLGAFCLAAVGARSEPERPARRRRS